MTKIIIIVTEAEVNSHISNSLGISLNNRTNEPYNQNYYAQLKSTFHFVQQS